MEEKKMKNMLDIDDNTLQPANYSAEELIKLREFVETVKNDDSRSALACWGDHDDYTHGY